MNVKKTLESIKLLLSGEEVEVKLESKLLIDGVTVIEADSFEEKASIFIVTETENVPLPVGTYEFEDGMTIVVEEEGTIASVVMPETEEEVVEEEVESELSKETVEEIIKDAPEVNFVTLEDFNSAINDMKTQFNSLKEQFELNKVELTDKDTEIETLKTDLAKLPATTKITRAPEIVLSRQSNINNGKGKTAFDSILNRINKN